MLSGTMRKCLPGEGGSVAEAFRVAPADVLRTCFVHRRDLPGNDD
jgi:hypothetical protein